MNTAQLLEYYNCKCVLEASKVSILTWARENKYLNLFMRRPRATMVLTPPFINVLFYLFRSNRIWVIVKVITM